jgi:hypothetical protein
MDILQSIREAKVAKVSFFGTLFEIDFSHFIPRGHYTSSKTFASYFMTMMWLGRFPLNLKFEDQFGSSILLYYLLESSGSFQKWSLFDSALQSFIGKSDNMNFTEIRGIVGTTSLEKMGSADFIRMRAVVEKSSLGTQAFGSEYENSPLFGVDTTEKVVGEKIFAFMGQRFTVDSWAISKLIYEEIIVNNKKVERGMSSSLDVAYAGAYNRFVLNEN